MSQKKPKLNQTVYCIYENSIMLKNARWLGQDSFIIEYDDSYVDNSKEWFYEDYGITWTTTLDKAKTILRKKFKIKKLKLYETKEHDYWEIDNEN